MKNRINWVFLIGVFGCSSVQLNAQIPDYYFSIDQVFWTSQSFKEDNKVLKFRVLAIKPAEYIYLAIELFEVPKDEFGKGKLKNSYFISDIDLDVIVIDEVELINWIAPNKVKLKVNDEKCFLLSLGLRKEDLVINKCSD